MRFYITIILACFVCFAQAQNIGGIINSYYSVSSLDIQNVTATVNSSSGISLGDTMLLIQMKGAQISTSNNGNYGNINDYAGAGNFELVEICDIQGNNVVFKTKLNQTFSADGLQLISIPSYSNAIITSTLTCSDWDGNSGGVLILRNSGVLSFNADVDVSEKGFRGGDHFYATNNCSFLSSNSDYEYDFASNLGALKGEGVSEYTSNNCGRGPLANGGGGGNDHNSGGAGGGNMSKGGNGGENDDPATFRCKGYHPGIGGIAQDNSLNKIFLGGGGGGGHSNSAPTPYTAGDGGGIVIIISDEISGNNFSIISNGGHGGDGIGDGGAGGGAGGSVLMDVNNIQSSLNVTLHGGNGGNGDGAMSVTNTNLDRCFGPGGGGSGGYLWYTLVSALTNITTSLQGGNNGVVSGSTHTPCLGLAQGAEPGEMGIENFNAQIRRGRKINSSCVNNLLLDIGNDTTLCPNETVTYTSNITGAYSWNTGSSSVSITTNNSGTYLLEVDDGDYIYCDSAIVSIDAPPNFDLGPDLYICNGVPITINAPTGFNNYVWSTGATSQMINANTSGIYSVTIGGNLCSSSDSVQVFEENTSNPFSANTFDLCDYGGVILNAGPTSGNYQWSNGLTSNEINVTSPEDLTVEFTTVNGCIDTATVSVIPCESIGIPNTITPNGDGENDLWIIRDIYSYPNNTITIFDRSGRVVYSASPYNNDWGGQQDGGSVPESVYYYSLTLDTEEIPFTGTITIIREN